MVFRKMIKINSTPPPKAHLAMKVNLFLLAFFVVLYSILFLCPFTPVHNDHHASIIKFSRNGTRRELIKREKPSFSNDVGLKIGMINMEDEDVSGWRAHGEITHVPFERVSKSLKWEHLFPEWIDEEEEVDGPSCPELPMPNFDEHGKVDMIVAKLPCNKGPGGGEWKNRDVHRLQVHLVAANMAARKGRGGGKMKVVVLSKCRPMVEVFGCDELVRREGDWWYYGVDVEKLKLKVSLPVGSCDLAMPLWDKGTVNEAYDVSKIQTRLSIKTTPKREAYVTVLHSSEAYVCGAIALAQSLLQTGTQRDLILLLDTSIPLPKRVALSRAGWKLRLIKRIRNPKAEKNSYNEYNYSKFRLWQLTDYSKIIFIDSDVVVLRSLDALFSFPQMSATGNDGSIFNSGIMVIEPSNCTFRTLMRLTDEIVSYNGGDQGFLNEVFVWWHRLPRRVNYLKNFWSNSTVETAVKNQMFGSDPPGGAYSIHFLGLKPWVCYRDYDCNWDVPGQRVYASDVAHARWWKVYDAMDGVLKGFCGLSEKRKVQLERERGKARRLGLVHEHWRINITDPRKFL